MRLKVDEQFHVCASNRKRISIKKKEKKKEITELNANQM